MSLETLFFATKIRCRISNIMNTTYSLIGQRILQAAQDTFLRYGFHGTILQEIALKAEVCKSII
jgi:hypothetical protein